MNSNVKAVARDRIVSRLKELEVSTHEALLYTTLLAHSSMTAGALCKETGIPDSKIYYALDGLSRKGMLIVQKGNPNLYLSMHPREALANLKAQLIEKLNEKTKEADVLADLLTPIYESVEKAEELELAYIIRGQKNIFNRMRTLIETARKEVTLFVSHHGVLEELEGSLMKAKEKRVNLIIAVTQEVFEKDALGSLGKIRSLCCTSLTPTDSPGMLIADVKTLLTVANWIEESAILTQDPNIVQVCRSYFDNPTWCRTTRQ